MSPTPRSTKQLQEEGRHTGKARGEALDNIDSRGSFDIPPGIEPPELALVTDIIDCMPAGVIGRIDSATINMMLEYHAMWRKGMAAWKADPDSSSARLSATAAGDRFFRLAAAFGLTPSGRAVLPQPEAGDDELQKLVGRLNGSDK